MSSSDNKAQVFKGRVVPRVKTTKHQQMMAAMKKTLEDPVAMAKVRQDSLPLPAHLHSPLAHTTVDQKGI
jgi:hypothetical protein